jgi:hypothetical protein
MLPQNIRLFNDAKSETVVVVVGVVGLIVVAVVVVVVVVEVVVVAVFLLVIIKGFSWPSSVFFSCLHFFLIFSFSPFSFFLLFLI